MNGRLLLLARRKMTPREESKISLTGSASRRNAVKRWKPERPPVLFLTNAERSKETLNAKFAKLRRRKESASLRKGALKKLKPPKLMVKTRRLMPMLLRMLRTTKVTSRLPTEMTLIRLPLKTSRPKIMLKKRARPQGINLKRMLKKIPEPPLLKVKTEEAKETTSVVRNVREVAVVVAVALVEVLRTWSTSVRNRLLKLSPMTTSMVRSPKPIRPRMILILRLMLWPTRFSKPRNLRRSKPMKMMVKTCKIRRTNQLR